MFHMRHPFVYGKCNRDRIYGTSAENEAELE